MDAHVSVAPSNFHTPEELAMRWKCSTAHIRNLIHRGVLRGIRIGTLWRIPVSEAEAYERHSQQMIEAA